ncbi:MAG: hypothetical protein A2020_00400 [Lentisphaerae bacterium GWF2_45_14]|nr:MAG: hypothetical protein A2020_00400 [Lentisphaerae bacterium GWF2_45_14]
MKKNLISVIVPALNESASLEQLYLRVKKVLDQEGKAFEFIFIDDGSTDETLNVLKMLNEKYSNVTILVHGTNHGKSIALMQGFAAAEGELAVLMDADLQDLPEELPKFLKKLDEGYDLVNGWRNKRKDTFMKRSVSQLFNYFTRKAFRCGLHDINCGYKIMHYEVYKRLRLSGDMHRLIPVIAMQLGFKIAETPIVHADRQWGKSRYSLLRYRGLLDMLSVMILNSTNIRPFHTFCEFMVIFSLIAVTLFCVSFTFPGTGFLSLLFINLCRFVAVWCVLVATLLPFFGILMEAMSRDYQNKHWHEVLLLKRFLPSKSHENITETPDKNES